MINAILTKIVGSKNERTLKKLAPVVQQINEFEARIQALGDEGLRAKKAEFRERLDQGATLDDLLPEAFAVVREAGRRALGMRHFDVQLVGGMVLHSGKIAEMKTGEGKTLVATLAGYLNALPGRGVHVVTVNDYLARRDSEWMGQLYRFLGLSVGVIQHDLDDRERQAAYAADITYGTNNEFGFDYLRDNMKFALGNMVQRGHAFAIVDEVDSILIDEARTPLIISGPAEESTDKYYKLDKIIPKLRKGAVIQGGNEYEVDDSGDYVVDEKARTATLTEMGVERCEKLTGIDNLYDPTHMETLHHISQALKAHVLYRRDVDYMVKDGEVVIVDEFTGRLMPGRRWSDGLHQAVEAKEGVKIERENQTLATITFQNYFRMYDKLSGMTGTADTESVEFDKIYNLEVVVIPTNRSLIRIENRDVVYRTEDEKWTAVVEEIDECQKRGQPVLVGTVSIEKSETLWRRCSAGRGSARRPERQVPRDGGRDRRPGRPDRLGHDRDQHGGSRHGHPARRKPGVPREAEAPAGGAQARRDARGRVEGGVRSRPGRVTRRVPGGARQGRRARGSPHHRHGAPRGAAHRQPAARPRGTAGRPGSLAVLPLARRRPDADLRG